VRVSLLTDVSLNHCRKNSRTLPRSPHLPPSNPNPNDPAGRKYVTNFVANTTSSDIIDRTQGPECLTFRSNLIEEADSSWTGETLCDSATRTTTAPLREASGAECTDLCLPAPRTFPMITHTARLLDGGDLYRQAQTTFFGTCPSAPRPSPILFSDFSGDYQQTITW